MYGNWQKCIFIIVKFINGRQMFEAKCFVREYSNSKSKFEMSKCFRNTFKFVVLMFSLFLLLIWHCSLPHLSLVLNRHCFCIEHFLLFLSIFVSFFFVDKFTCFILVLFLKIICFIKFDILCNSAKSLGCVLIQCSVWKSE